MKTKFAIITDLHFGPSRCYKNSPERMKPVHLDFVKKAVAEINKDPEIEFVLQLGDIVQEEPKAPSQEQDLKNLALAIETLRGLNVPLYSAIGNHDTVTLSYQDLCQAFNVPKLNFTFETNNLTGIMLYTHSENHCFNSVSEDQIEWLREELSKATKPVIITAHHPFMESDLSKNYWFDGKESNAFVHESAKLRKIFKDSGKVIACFSGHLHTNVYVKSEGIPYFTTQSINEEHHFDGIQSECFSVVTIDTNEISMNVFGKDAAEFAHTR